MGRKSYLAPPDTEPWERQSREGPRAWEAFQCYRDLGPNRTLRQVTEALGKSMSTIQKVSMTHNWTARVDAWDREQDRQLRQAQAKAIQEMRVLHADTGNALLRKAVKALKDIPLEEIKAGDVARLVEVGAKLERISRGDVGDVIEQREGESLPVVTFYMPDNGRENTE